MGNLRLLIATICLVRTGLYATKNNQLAETLSSESIMSCDEGWYAFEDFCYKGFTDTANFQEGEDKCVKHGGHLVAVISQDVQEFIVVQIVIQLEISAFIGLRDDGHRRMLWTNGSELSFASWNKNEPSKKAPDGKEENCVEILFAADMNDLGKWNDVACDRKMPFICQKPKVLRDGNAEEERSFCSSSRDGFSYRNTKYHFIHHRKSWEEAEEYCAENYGGHLASLTDFSVQKFVHYSSVKCHAEDKTWIGIQIKPNEVQIWSSGWYLGFSNWVQNAAHHATKVSCGFMRKEDGRWNSSSCSEEHPFVCEKSTVAAPARLEPANKESACPRDPTDWRDLGGDYCYIFAVKAHVSWYEANFLCMKTGGTLASIHSKAEELVLKQFLTNIRAGLSIGLFRHNISHRDYQFQWVDHSNVRYINWRSGEPNEVNEECVEIQPWPNMEWNDIRCSNAMGYICSTKKVSKKHSTGEGEEKPSSTCECLPTPAIIGVVLCVFLVIILIGVVLYNVKPWNKAEEEQQTSGKRKSSAGSGKPRYRTGEIVVSDQIYENIES